MVHWVCSRHKSFSRAHQNLKMCILCPKPSVPSASSSQTRFRSHLSRLFTCPWIKRLLFYHQTFFFCVFSFMSNSPSREHENEQFWCLLGMSNNLCARDERSAAYFQHCDGSEREVNIFVCDITWWQSDGTGKQWNGEAAIESHSQQISACVFSLSLAFAPWLPWARSQFSRPKSLKICIDLCFRYHSTRKKKTIAAGNRFRQTHPKVNFPSAETRKTFRIDLEILFFPAGRNGRRSKVKVNRSSFTSFRLESIFLSAIQTTNCWAITN